MSAAALGVAYAGLAVLVFISQRRVAFAPLAMGPVLLYVAATIGMFVCYARALAFVRPPAPVGRRTAALIAVPVALWLGLAATPPSLSIDLYSYLTHGYLVAEGRNPYLVPSSSVASSDYGRALADRGWLPMHGTSPYGPLWTRIEALAYGATGDVRTQARLLKAVVVVAGLIGAALIWLTLSAVAPPWRAFGVVLFAWNPLVLFELAGEGHNDALVLVPTLFGLWLIARGRASVAAGAAATAALIKLNALLVAPPLAAYVLRGPGRFMPPAPRWQAIAGGFLAAGVVAVAGWLLYGRLWAGADTFGALREHTTAHVTPSTAGALFVALAGRVGEATAAAWIDSVLRALLFGAVLLISLRATTIDRTFRACGRLSLLALLLVSSYWPWYLVVPIALFAVAPGAPLSVPLVMAFSLAGRLAAPLERLRTNGFMDWPTITVAITIIGLWLPALMVAPLVVAQLRRHTNRPVATAEDASLDARRGRGMAMPFWWPS